MLQFGASLTDDTRSINYDCNTFIIQATGCIFDPVEILSLHFLWMTKNCLKDILRITTLRGNHNDQKHTRENDAS